MRSRSRSRSRSPCRPALALALALLAAPGCRSGPVPAPGSPYTLVQLKTGPRTEPLPQQQRAEVMAGHFANMDRLAHERQLLVAGPYGKNRSDPALRGVFVLDTADRARARALAETDPGFAAGVFRFEFHDLVTNAPLRAFLAGELAQAERAKAEGRTPAPGDGARGYVLLTAADGDAAAAALADDPAVLLFARLDGTKAWVLLDAKDLAAARALLEPVAARLGEHALDEWFASSGLAALPPRAH